MASKFTFEAVLVLVLVLKEGKIYGMSYELTFEADKFIICGKCHC